MDKVNCFDFWVKRGSTTAKAYGIAWAVVLFCAKKFVFHRKNIKNINISRKNDIVSNL